MSTAEADLNARIDADNARIRTELRNHLHSLDDSDLYDVVMWLADEVPDAVNDALLETGNAP